MRRLLAFLLNICRYEEVIRTMARRELAGRYVSTLGGAVWAIVHPMAIVATFWFVFSVGFKAQGPGNMPFVVYFLCGLVPWLTFNEVLTHSANAVIGNAHLVKKVVFPTEVLPLVHLGAAAITHGVLVVILVIVAALFGYAPTLNLLALAYYFGAMCFLLLGLCWFLSALNVFHRDIGQATTIVLNLWFWLTPIVWTLEMIPESLHWLVRLNPLLYIVEGYRNATVYAQPFWLDLSGAAYYWSVALLAFVFGAFVFRRLKPDFADVL